MLNSKLLKHRCRSNWSELTAGMEIRESDAGRLHAFKDNGASILAVAHTDFVSKTKHFQHLQLDDRHLIFNGQLDDRLGIYTILDVLPSMGLKFDVLLTDLEEVGASTAGDFRTDKKYNWMFMFDRRGVDAVTYQYDSREWLASLSKHVDIGRGSFSDISKLGHLGCSGVNVGCGYYEEHSPTHHMNVEHWKEQVRRFASFYQAFHDRLFPHEETDWCSTSSGWGNDAFWRDPEDAEIEAYYRRKWRKSTERKLDKKSGFSGSFCPSDEDHALYCWDCNLFLREEECFYTVEPKGGTAGQDPKCPTCGEMVSYEEVGEIREMEFNISRDDYYGGGIR